jgi:hypothetical protein
MTVLNSNHNPHVHLDEDEEASRVPEVTPAPAPTTNPAASTDAPAAKRIQDFATRETATGKQGFEKKNVLLVGGVIAIALLFFLFAQFQSKKPVRKTQQIAQTKTQAPTQPKAKGSITPNMDPYQGKRSDNSGDRVSISDIERTRQPNFNQNKDGGPLKTNTPPSPPPPHNTRPLSSVPAFKDTQQTFTDPAPYNSPQNNIAAQQEQNALKEPSLVFVKSPQTSSTHSSETSDDDGPVLQLKEGTRIQAHLESEASTAIHAPVIAVVDYTYAIGDQVLVPAGARIIGKLTQADSTGNIGIEFDQIEMLSGPSVKISAVGAGLDLGPIKGNVYGKHEGRNFLVKAAAGLGSAAAMLVGSNVNGAYSEADMIRERAAANIGTAGDTQLQIMNADTHLVVAVPANTKIYVVWTARPKPSPSANSSTTRNP